MSTVRKISDIIEGIEIVSENAIKKYGKSSRSRVRIFDMAKSLSSLETLSSYWINKLRQKTCLFCH